MTFSGLAVVGVFTAIFLTIAFPKVVLAFFAAAAFAGIFSKGSESE